MIYLELFLEFAQVGLFSIGGGYASIPIIQSRVVDGRGWLSMKDFTDLITIAEMTPGPIAVNSATFVGMRVAGVLGGIVATLGCIFPALIIVSLLAFLYYRFRNLSVVQGVLTVLRPVIVALIASAGLSMLMLALWGGSAWKDCLAVPDFVAVGIFICGFFLLRKFKLNPIFIIFGSGAVGALFYLLI